MTEHIDATRAALYVAGAIGWALTGYASKVTKNDDVEFDPVRAGKTVAIGLVAGLVMAYQGDEFNEEAYIAATAIAIPIVDKGVNVLLDARTATETHLS